MMSVMRMDPSFFNKLSLPLKFPMSLTLQKSEKIRPKQESSLKLKSAAKQAPRSVIFWRMIAAVHLSKTFQLLLETLTVCGAQHHKKTFEIFQEIS